MRLRSLVPSFLSLLSLIFITSLQIQACFENERKGLLDIKSYFIAIDSYTAENELRSWVIEDTNCCHWKRVKCSYDNINSTIRRHITHLSLDLLLISDYEIFNVSLLSPFQELQSLDLSNNNFEGFGNIEGFSRLKKLESLDLSNNNLNISILSSLNQLTSLRTLKLTVNHGSLSAQDFVNFSRLEELDLSNNRLSLAAKDFLNLKSLKMLNLRGNYFSGSIQGFSRMEKLESLDLSENFLNISILSSLNQFTSLRTLILQHNKLNGSLPAQDFVTSQLEVLDLSENHLVGSLLVEDFQNWKSLKVLDLSQNYFNGSIQGLCTMKGLIGLSLSYNHFSGKLPECLGMLTNLKVLDLSNNFFTGKFPSCTSNLTSIEYLSLYGNYFQGSFLLNNLANNSKLQHLLISSSSPSAQVETESAKWFPKFQLKSLTIQNCNINKDQGSMIPSFLQYQHELKFVDLSHNKMVGEFPNWLIHNNSRIKFLILRNNSFEGNLKLSSKDITYLDISNNNVSGLLQKDIGTFLPMIESLNLSFNNFDGNIPSSFCEMEKIEFMDLSHNHFSGELPQNLATNWTSLKLLSLSNNFLHGNIPTFLRGNIPKFLENTKLNFLDLHNNYFNGTLKELFLQKFRGLVVLDISNNSIHGEIPSSIGDCVGMEVILMAQNQLEGEIPSAFYSMTELEVLDLSENRLSGSISDLGGPSLRFLYLQKNALSGGVPLSLLKSPFLLTLDLRDNKFSGYIPDWIDKLSILEVLLLGGNKFEGNIPTQLCHLSLINIMDLSHNVINGSIPSCFENMPFGLLPKEDDQVWKTKIQFEGFYDFQSETEEDWFPVIGYNLSILPIYVNSLLTDDILAVAEFRTKSNYYSYRGNILMSMTGLDLSRNNLNGTIPSQLGNFQQLRSLNLSHNHLSGSIPKKFYNLTQIESLDLSFNNLSGQIPLELTQLNFLSIFNVSYNNLSGMTPNSGQFATFDEENYRGNPNLCGPLLKHRCEGVDTSTPSSSESNNTQEEKEEKVDMVAFYWSFTASYITILLGLIAVLCINPNWRMAWFYFIGKVICKCFPSFPLY